MAHPEAESGGANVEIQPDEVLVIAGDVSKVRDTIAEASTSAGGGGTSVTDATTTGAEGLKGWTSAATLSAALRQWSRKSRALTDGPAGLRDFSAALKGLVAQTSAADDGNASAVAKTMKDFQRPYEPHLTEADMGPVANFAEDRYEDAKDFFGDLKIPGVS